MQQNWISLNRERQPITTSEVVSEVFGQSHQTVLAKIDMLDTDSDFFHHNFTEIQYIDVNSETKTAYEMTRDGFGFISMDFTGKHGAELCHEYITFFDKNEYFSHRSQHIYGEHQTKRTIS